MKKTLFKAAFLSAVLILGTLTGCENDSPESGKGNEEEGEGREYISLTASIPDEAGTAGNGGTMAFAITHEEAIDPNFTLNIYQNGFGLRSARTARVRPPKTAKSSIISNIPAKTAAYSTNTRYAVKMIISIPARKLNLPIS